MHEFNIMIMRILSRIKNKYFHKRNTISASPYNEDQCANRCRYAINNRGEYFCVVKNLALNRNSVIYGCSQYRLVILNDKLMKREKGYTGILCPNCKSILIDLAGEGRFKCRACGKIFS